ncbi:hypothetical protein QQY66_48885 [Streptomyces sp. DG2A-72]|uniref:hypothetical protein n=1 Tax=Streptomyces sp. DG2A-72 TaxID=3051386 RepID=UPI00265BE359|nr:hypothetical protein [Streptomyces sp. DG2A-72]MDO0939229.1 hypothetical protein [Streptomyces sp. DG2A-72]
MPHGTPRTALRGLAAPPGESAGAFGAFTADSVRFADRPLPGALRARSPAKGFRPCAFGAHRAEKHAARRAASWVTPRKHNAKGAISVTPITCPQCGGLSAYGIRPDGLFGCPECGNLLDSRDIDLDGFEVWAVDETGTLGKVHDPTEARERLHEYLAEYLDEPLDSHFEASLLNSFEWAAADILDAMDAGLKISEPTQ